MCVITSGYVATGPGSRDGKIAIWRHEEESDEDLGFETFSNEEVNYAATEQEKSEAADNNNYILLSLRK